DQLYHELFVRGNRGFRAERRSHQADQGRTVRVAAPPPVDDDRGREHPEAGDRLDTGPGNGHRQLRQAVTEHPHERLIGIADEQLARTDVTLPARLGEGRLAAQGGVHRDRTNRLALDLVAG